MLLNRNLPFIERLEGVRNVKYFLLNLHANHEHITMRDIEHICGAGLLKGNSNGTG